MSTLWACSFGDALIAAAVRACGVQDMYSFAERLAMEDIRVLREFGSQLTG